MKIETLMYFYIQFNTKMGDNPNNSDEIDLRLISGFFLLLFFLLLKRDGFLFLSFSFVELAQEVYFFTIQHPLTFPHSRYPLLL